eukprot:5610631-Prymnesium_polylepis.1
MDTEDDDSMDTTECGESGGEQELSTALVHHAMQSGAQMDTAKDQKSAKWKARQCSRRGDGETNEERAEHAERGDRDRVRAPEGADAVLALARGVVEAQREPVHARRGRRVAGWLGGRGGGALAHPRRAS